MQIQCITFKPIQTFFTILNFFANSLSSLRFSPAVCLSLFSTWAVLPVSHQRAFSMLCPLLEYHPFLVVPRILFSEPLKTAISYLSLEFVHLSENPYSTQAISFHKIRITFTTAKSPVDNGNLVTKPIQRLSILSFIAKFVIDEYTLSSLINCLYCFAARSVELAVIYRI